LEKLISGADVRLKRMETGLRRKEKLHGRHQALRALKNTRKKMNFDPSGTLKPVDSKSFG
jgi:hypothetical protein